MKVYLIMAVISFLMFVVSAEINENYPSACLMIFKRISCFLAGLAFAGLFRLIF